MLPDPVVLLFAPGDGKLRGVAGSLPAGLRAQGLSLRTSPDLSALYGATQESLMASTAVAIILAGLPAQNVAAAVRLRALHPQVYLVALADTKIEHQIVRLLHSGADAYCSYQASPALLAAIVYRLLARAAAGTKAPSQKSPGYHGVWSLRDQGWALVAPDGKSISLTTGERAFLSTLLSYPENSATHAALLEALNNSYANNRLLARPRTLGVLVSRLRRKCTSQGVAVPLQSVHNWGYMFTGPM